MCLLKHGCNTYFLITKKCELCLPFVTSADTMAVRSMLRFSRPWHQLRTVGALQGKMVGQGRHMSTVTDNLSLTVDSQTGGYDVTYFEGSYDIL